MAAFYFISVRFIGIVFQEKEGRFSVPTSNAARKYFCDGERILFEHERFEKHYAVYGENAVEVKTLISPDFVENVLELSEHFNSSDIIAAFEDGDFLLAVETKMDLFSSIRAKQSVAEVEDVLHDFLREVHFIHLVIDYLHGDRPT